MARGHCGTCRGTSWSGPRCKDRVRSPPGGVTWGRPGRVLGSFSRFWWTVFPASHPLSLSGVASGVKPQVAPQILRQGSCDHPTFSKGDHKTQRKGGPNSKNWDLRNSDCTRRRRDRSAHSLSSHSFFFRFLCACLDAARIAEPLGRFGSVVASRVPSLCRVPSRSNVPCCAPPRARRAPTVHVCSPHACKVVPLIREVCECIVRDDSKCMRQIANAIDAVSVSDRPIRLA